MARHRTPLTRLPVPPTGAAGSRDADPLVQVLAAEERFDALLEDVAREAEAALASARQRVAELEAAGPVELTRELGELESRVAAGTEAAIARVAGEMRGLAERFDGVDDATCDRLARWVVRRSLGIREPIPAAGAGGDAP
jgi:hypothetical protein